MSQSSALTQIEKPSLYKICTKRNTVRPSYVSSFTVSFKQYTKSLRHPTTRERPHTTGDENSSPGRVNEASVCPSPASRIQAVPSVEAAATRGVPLLPTTEPSNTNGLEYTFPVVWKVQIKEPLAPSRQYRQPSCDPHKTL